MKEHWDEFIKGIFKMNPIFVAVLGLCPTLAITTSLDNAIGMGFAASFVLLFSAIFVSSIRKIIPSNVRIPIFIVIIATFVTIAQLLMKGFFPSLDKSLGIFVPLIVVNCIILGRAESFSSKNSVFKSILDSLGMGLGFLGAIVLISLIREFFGTAQLSIFGNTILDLTGKMEPTVAFILAPGALLTMGLLLALFNWIGDINVKMQCANVEAHNPDNIKKEKDNKDNKETKETKETKENKDNKENKENKDNKDTNNNNAKNENRKEESEAK